MGSYKVTFRRTIFNMSNNGTKAPIELIVEGCQSVGTLYIMYLGRSWLFSSSTHLLLINSNAISRKIITFWSHSCISCVDTTFSTYRKESRLVRYLTALQTNYEYIWGFFLHRTPLPSIDLASLRISCWRAGSKFKRVGVIDGQCVLISKTDSSLILVHRMVVIFATTIRNLSIGTEIIPFPLKLKEIGDLISLVGTIVVDSIQSWQQLRPSVELCCFLLWCISR